MQLKCPHCHTRYDIKHDVDDAVFVCLRCQNEFSPQQSLLANPDSPSIQPSDRPRNEVSAHPVSGQDPHPEKQPPDSASEPDEGEISGENNTDENSTEAIEPAGHAPDLAVDDSTPDTRSGETEPQTEEEIQCDATATGALQTETTPTEIPGKEADEEASEAAGKPEAGQDDNNAVQTENAIDAVTMSAADQMLFETSDVQNESGEHDATCEQDAIQKQDADTDALTLEADDTLFEAPDEIAPEPENEHSDAADEDAASGNEQSQSAARSEDGEDTAMPAADLPTNESQSEAAACFDQAPLRNSASIWVWLITVMILLTAGGFWIQKDAWLDNRWVRGHMIALGFDLPQRARDWRIETASIVPEWISQPDGSRLLVIHGRLVNLLGTAMPVPAIRLHFFAANAPDKEIGSAVQALRKPSPLQQQGKPFRMPEQLHAHAYSSGQRAFTIVADAVPDQTGDFTITPVIR